VGRSSPPIGALAGARRPSALDASWHCNDVTTALLARRCGRLRAVLPMSRCPALERRGRRATGLWGRCHGVAHRR
jgi:hypothetical protein